MQLLMPASTDAAGAGRAQAPAGRVPAPTPETGRGSAFRTVLARMSRSSVRQDARPDVPARSIQQDEGSDEAAPEAVPASTAAPSTPTPSAVGASTAAVPPQEARAAGSLQTLDAGLSEADGTVEAASPAAALTRPDAVEERPLSPASQGLAPQPSQRLTRSVRTRPGSPGVASGPADALAALSSGSEPGRISSGLPAARGGAAGPSPADAGSAQKPAPGRAHDETTVRNGEGDRVVVHAPVSMLRRGDAPRGRLQPSSGLLKTTGIPFPAAVRYARNVHGIPGTSKTSLLRPGGAAAASGDAAGADQTVHPALGTGAEAADALIEHTPTDGRAGRELVEALLAGVGGDGRMAAVATRRGSSEQAATFGHAPEATGVHALASDAPVLAAAGPSEEVPAPADADPPQPGTARDVVGSLQPADGRAAAEERLSGAGSLEQARVREGEPGPDTLYGARRSIATVPRAPVPSHERTQTVTAMENDAGVPSPGSLGSAVHEAQPEAHALSVSTGTPAAGRPEDAGRRDRADGHAAFAAGPEPVLPVQAAATASPALPAGALPLVASESRPGEREAGSGWARSGEDRFPHRGDEALSGMSAAQVKFADEAVDNMDDRPSHGAGDATATDAAARVGRKEWSAADFGQSGGQHDSNSPRRFRTEGSPEDAEGPHAAFAAALRHTAGTAPAAADAAETPAPSRVPPEPQALADTVHRAVLQTQEGTHSLHIELDPPELGRLHIRITVDGGVVNADIVAESGATGRVLEHTLPQLRQALGAQGLDVGRLSVAVGSGGGGLARGFGGQGETGDAPVHRPGGRPATRYVAAAIPAAPAGGSDGMVTVNILA